MATITETETTPATALEGDQCVVMQGVGWSGYKTLLRVRGERPRPKMIYLDGDVLLTSPSYPHESLKKRLGHFVMEVAISLKIRFIASGSTTFRRQKENGGVEPDESFYLANADRVRGKKRLSVGVDPPPELVIEVVQSYDADDAVEVYRRFRVPEVWVCDGNVLHILAFQTDETYTQVNASVAFPFLSAAEICEWVVRPQTETDAEWGLDLRAWVLDVPLPRYQGRANDAGGA